MAFRSKIYFVIIFVITIVFSEEKYTADEVQQLFDALGTTYCPHNNLCQANASLPLNDDSVSPCCDDCSCDDDCWKKGNCCPDKDGATNLSPDKDGATNLSPDKHSDTIRSPTTECKVSLVKGIGHYHYFDTYWVVNKCPDTTKNTNLVEKCEVVSFGSMDEYLWVSDRASNQIFNNKWCAECHGVKDPVEWRLGTECKDVLNGDFDFTDEASLENCNSIMIPPKRINVGANICNKPDISVCNETGEWQNFNKSIAEACGALVQPFIVERSYRDIVYKNVFCAMCNEKGYKQSWLENVCKPRDTLSRGIENIYIGLISWRFYSNNDQKKKCALNEVEDEILGVCRRLTCPMLTAPYYGSCERVTERTNRLQITMLYRIEPLWTRLSDIEQFDLLMFGENTIRHFERSSGMASKGCTSCTHSIWASHEVSETPASNETSTLPAYFVLFLKYVTDGKCGQAIISKGLRALVGTDSQIAMPKGQSVNVSVSLERRVFDDVMLTTSYTFSTTNPDCPPQSPIIHLSQSELCPVIALTNTDYSKLMDKRKGSERKMVNELFGIEGEEATVSEQVQGNLTVCLDDYRAIFVNSASSAVPKLQLVEMCTATMAVILGLLSSMI